MMKLFAIFLSFIISFLQMLGISGSFTPTEEHYTDYEGVYITIESINDADGGKVIDAVWHNETDKTICFGLGYTIEYLNGDGWESVQLTDFAIPELACILEGGRSGTQSYTTKYFNLLRPGTYRIMTEFYVQESDIGAQSTYALFDVKY